LTLTSLFSCPSRIGVDSFSGLMNPRFLIHKFFFLYDRNESSPLRSFKLCVPPPPNPLPMTDEKKDKAITRRDRNPPACKCGYRAKFMNPPAGLDYILFFVVRFLYR
jgi:hypothetical protein